MRTRALHLSLLLVVLLSSACSATAPTATPTPAASPSPSAVAVSQAATALPATKAVATATPTTQPTRQPTVTPPTATQTAPVASPTATQTTVPATPTPITPTATLAPQQSATVDLRREFVAEMAKGLLNGAEAQGEVLTLARGSDGRYAGQGEVVSAIFRPPLAFNDLVLSWNANAPTGTGLTFYARVQSGGVWSGWHTMGLWRDGRGSSVRGQEDAWGAVETDTLALRRAADAWQFRVVFTTSDTALTPRLRSVSVAVADRTKQPVGPAVALPAGWARDLPVPVESQAIQDPAVAWSICSPTSLYMVLRYWGLDTTLPTVYNGVRDGPKGIFGNWPLNTAYAAEQGFDAHVARMYSLDQVRAEIAAGRPVAISIRYDAGQLPGAPLNSTSGHLIVVRGFTESGGVIVNDPAAPDRSGVRRVLRAVDLERVWLRSGGVAYLVKPSK